jgi:hypothetical protein
MEAVKNILKNMELLPTKNTYQAMLYSVLFNFPVESFNIYLEEHSSKSRDMLSGDKEMLRTILFIYGLDCLLKEADEQINKHMPTL